MKFVIASLFAAMVCAIDLGDPGNDLGRRDPVVPVLKDDHDPAGIEKKGKHGPGSFTGASIPGYEDTPMHALKFIFSEFDWDHNNEMDVMEATAMDAFVLDAVTNSPQMTPEIAVAIDFVSGALLAAAGDDEMIKWSEVKTNIRSLIDNEELSFEDFKDGAFVLRDFYINVYGNAAERPH